MDGALLDLTVALESIEDLRRQTGGGEQTRAGLLEKYSEDYDRMIAWQIEAGNLRKAIEYSERRRARVLLDQLAVAQVDLRASIPEEIRHPMLIREADARARMSEFQRRVSLLNSRHDIPRQEQEAEIVRLENLASKAESDYQEVYEEIKNASPLWTQGVMSGGEAVSLEAIQKKLVPEKGMLLSFLIGMERSYLFSIPPLGRKPEVWTLEITVELARSLGIDAGPLTSEVLSDLLMGRDSEESSLGLFQSLSDSARGVTITEAVKIQRTADELHDLWSLLIPEELWSRVARCTEVIVIPDGPLHWIPFETLVIETGDTPSKTRYWLDEGPVVRYVPSATTLHNIAQRRGEGSSQAAQQLVVSLSDPIYDPDEVKTLLASLETRENTPDGSASSITSQILPRKRYVSAGGTFVRLPGTARESEAIEKAFKHESETSSVVALRQLEATESNLRESISDKRYVHLATHGLVEQGGKSIFASLALTAPTGKEVESMDDGFLQLFEIYDLKLPACELAVLSACQTNVGKQVKGEGVFGLSRGFLVAGARRVVASQWSVDDESTAALIGAFFEQIAEAERAGRTIDYSTALRDAKRKIRSQEKWSDPFYWAPFILMGKK